MKTGHWSAAFTIVVDSLQVDFMELPEQSRIEILKALITGETTGGKVLKNKLCKWV